MADFRTEIGIGARIKLARRERGFRSTRDLADAIAGGNITQAVLENIESGQHAARAHRDSGVASRPTKPQ